MGPSKDKNLPQPTKGDHAHALTKGVISAIPWVGGTVAELFGIVIAPPLVKRRDQWLETIAQRLSDLEGKVDGFKISALAMNEAFITAIMHATAAAMKNHQKEKLDALRNAVVNSALPSSPEADVQLIFLGWVDWMTPMHLGLLALLSDPASWKYSVLPNEKPGVVGTTANIIYLGFPALRAQGTIADKVMNDIANEGLVGGSTSHMVDGYMVMAPQVTELGTQFLAFISEPKL